MASDQAGQTSISEHARATAPISLATVNGVMALYIILCTFVTGARMFARFSVHQRLWWDDWTMVLAWLGLIGLCILQIIMAQNGGGVDIEDVPKHNFQEFGKAFVDSEIVARLAIFFAKLSILLLYIRIFFPARCKKTAFYWVIQATIWLNLLYTIALVLVVTLQCIPSGLPLGSTCVNEAMVLIMASVINIISDIAVLIIPLGSVWRLQISSNKKWGLFALFAFGALAPLASIARLAYQIPEASGSNKTVIYMIVMLLASAEQVIAIVVGSAPVASAWILKQNRKRQHSPLEVRTITERLKPSRESGQSGKSGQTKRSRKALDPFPLTEPTQLENSEELQLRQDSSATAIAYAAKATDSKAGLSEEVVAADDPRVYAVSTTTVEIETTPRRWP